jgi:hypothetical protein
VPLFFREAVLSARDVIQEVLQPFCPVVGKGDCHSKGVNDPTENLFVGRPACVAQEKLLDRYRFTPCSGVFAIQGAEDVVDRIKKDTTDSV